MKKYDAEFRMEYKSDYSDWECFDGVDDLSEYSAEDYITDAVDYGEEIAEMMERGEIEDFEVRIVDAKSGKVADHKRASSLYPGLYRIKAEDEDED